MNNTETSVELENPNDLLNDNKCYNNSKTKETRDVNTVLNLIRDHKKRLTLSPEEQKQLFLYFKDLYNQGNKYREKLLEIIDILDIESE